MTTTRLTMEPKREEQGDRVRIVGGKMDLAVFGPGSSQAPIDSPVPDKLVLHAAFLEQVRGATPEFTALPSRVVESGASIAAKQVPQTAAYSGGCTVSRDWRGPRDWRRRGSRG